MRELLANAMRYVAPENRMVDPVSGYPFEGWNQDPARGLFLRSFTQLTAIGQYMELLANVAAGQCDDARTSQEPGPCGLTRLVKSLRQDQRDPTLSADNLLGNFLDLATGKRLGPLAGRRREAQVRRCVRPGEGRGRLEGAPGQGMDRPAERATARPRSSDPPRTAGTISTASWPPSATRPRSRRSWTSLTSVWS